MDEKVYRDTGKINPSMTSDWEERAQAAARSHHETRTVNKGKIDIGGGRFMDPEEVQAIASSRVQPVLDDINDKAEAERERRLALKAEEEARKDEEQRRREREKEVALLNKQAQGMCGYGPVRWQDFVLTSTQRMKRRSSKLREMRRRLMRGSAKKPKRRKRPKRRGWPKRKSESRSSRIRPNKTHKKKNTTQRLRYPPPRPL
jgi:hypothetical protein